MMTMRQAGIGLFVACGAALAMVRAAEAQTARQAMEVICGPANMMYAKAEMERGEKRVMSMRAEAGWVSEVWADHNSGSWSVFMVKGDTVCAIAAGANGVEFGGQKINGDDPA